MKPKVLSPLEHEIMDIVWELGQCSVKEVLERINQNKQLAYTTIATILQRLYEKGLVTRKGQGVAYFYSPKLSKKSYSKNLAQSFLNKFFSSYGDVAITSFAESIEKLPKKKKEYLLELLKNHDENK